jgi:hypothetical protein
MIGRERKSLTNLVVEKFLEGLHHSRLIVPVGNSGSIGADGSCLTDRSETSSRIAAVARREGDK